jgi:hypothetical protein
MSKYTAESFKQLNKDRQMSDYRKEVPLLLVEKCKLLQSMAYFEVSVIKFTARKLLFTLSEPN